jgi:4-amino-4-deoxy-L-arabinose transferase-like glycosyltransferase
MIVTSLPDRPDTLTKRGHSYRNAILTLLSLWLILFFSALFSPPLLDDADSTHASAARFIVLSGDWVTLHVNGVRYLEKAPLPYWLVALCFKIFGFNTFSAHLPQALGVLLLALLGYRWANQAFGSRVAFYTGLATLTSLGVFLFTRIFIPEVLLSLLVCTSLYYFLQSLHPTTESGARRTDSWTRLFPYSMWTALALAVLTKGLVALVFVFGTAIVYLALTGEYKKWRSLKPISGALLFFLIAAPWHVLAGLRNTGGGHGFFWFYFVNEHFLRFLGRRIPMDYNRLPASLYWSLHLVWLFPWSLFAGLLIYQAITSFRRYSASNPLQSDQLSYWQPFAVVVVGIALRDTLHIPYLFTVAVAIALFFLQGLRRRQADSIPGTALLHVSTSSQRTTLLLTLFSILVLTFFSLSTNQEYYTFPAYLPLLILITAALSRAENIYAEDKFSRRWITVAHATFTVIGLTVAIALVIGLWSARHLPYVADIGDLLAHRNVGGYTLAMSHFFDLTGPSFAALRLPATLAAITLAFGPAIAWFLRTKRHHLYGTVAIAATAAVFLVAAHIALVRFGSMLSSQNLAEKIHQLEAAQVISPDSQLILYGDQSYGSSILFYLNQPTDQPASLVNGRTTSMLFGSTFPDAPDIFLTDSQLLKVWGTGARKILFVPLEERDNANHILGNNKILLAETSGKALFTDRPLDKPLPPAPINPISSPSQPADVLSLVPIAFIVLAILFICAIGIFLFKETAHAWNPVSVAILIISWLILQLNGIFSPGLLDDVDSVYIEIARQMLHRHDFVTPYIDGIRFFDKPPLLYWMAASSMAIFGESDWAGRIPLTLAVLALLLSVYALGIRFFSAISPAAHPDRGGLYAALAVATCIGPYLFTRFLIPDILICLWMTLAVHLTLIALDRVNQDRINQHRTDRHQKSNPALLPCLAFAAILALNLLTKGLIGLVFPIAFVLLYLALTKQLRLLPKLHIIPSTAVFLAIAAPWHILAALRNPAIPLPASLGLPATGGWAWFYLYNEHIARFFSKRIPHDYGQTPVWLFWLMLLIWIMPWGAFLPAAFRLFLPQLRRRLTSTPQEREAALSLVLWIVIVMGFFTLSARQEYYSLPAIPALALLAGGALAWSEGHPASTIRHSVMDLSFFLLLPLALLITAVCGYFAITAPHMPAGTDLATLLKNNPDLYNLSLGHLYDLTGDAMGLFRGPLTTVAIGMIVIGPIALLLRRRNHPFAANITLAVGMTITLLAAHEGYVRFNPILGSKDLAEAINKAQSNANLAQQSEHPARNQQLPTIHQPLPTNNQQLTTTSPPSDLIIIDGELTSGSSLVFYTRQQVHLINGRVNGLWYGSFWPDAPAIFETEASLHSLWADPRRIFLFTYNPTARQRDLAPFGRVYTLASAGGKTVLTNHP